ncbi:RlpA-like double-psi beta-barrel-protein domain-containing protein-containing protein [Mycena sanguinolenta]|nr:RlpA-like double-psi beta-barrel-protein domain-containing protein-containing protein [Mycena sanguinolenta]
MFSKTFSALFFPALDVSASPALQARQEDGLATYYDPNGGTGACGNVLQNSDFIVALGEGNWDGGAHCGQTVNVQCTQDQGNTVQVTVQDLCPGCQGANGIDLSESAMAAHQEKLLLRIVNIFLPFVKNFEIAQIVGKLLLAARMVKFFPVPTPSFPVCFIDPSSEVEAKSAMTMLTTPLNRLHFTFLSVPSQLLRGSRVFSSCTTVRRARLGY